MRAFPRERIDPTPRCGRGGVADRGTFDPVSLRARIISTLVFLGMSMAVPLAILWLDLQEIDGALATLQADDGQVGPEAPSPAQPAKVVPVEARLARAAAAQLREAVGLAEALVGKRGAELARDRKAAERSLGRFGQLFDAFKAGSPKAFRSVPDLDKALGLAAPGDEDWGKAFAAVQACGGKRWSEDPLDLQMALEQLCEVVGSGNQAGMSAAVANFKQEATEFRRKLASVAQASLEVGGTGDPATGPDDAARALQVRRRELRDTQVAVLEVLAQAKHREVGRASFFLAAAAVLALLFTRILWRDVLDPLMRLRVSMNNMAMSGRPSKVETHGPPEVNEVLQAYNRLLDLMVSETKGPDRVECGRCRQGVLKGSSYCSACGMPMAR